MADGDTRAMRPNLEASVLAALLLLPSSAAASDGAYGRLEGDGMVEAEVGGSYFLAPPAARGPSLTARAGFFYLQTVGLIAQYEDRLGSAELIARTIAGAVEIRPLFLGRFTQNMERGPAHLDLLADSFGLTLGVFHSWERHPQCRAAPRPACTSHGMELGLGFELPFLPQASTPYLGLRGAVRWGLSELGADTPSPPAMGLVTLTLGYKHVFALHLVDAGDGLDP